MSERRYRVAPGVAATEIDGEVTLLDPRSGLYYGLDGGGARAWAHLETPSTLGQLVSVVCGEFDVDPATARADLEALVESLTDAGLVEVVDRDA